MNPLRVAPDLWRRDDALVALMLALLAAVLSYTGWLWRADRFVYDTGLALQRKPAPADLVIVAIDDASIEAIGRWPWRRSVHATLLERLAVAKPRAIGLDLVLSEQDPDARQDDLLAASLARAGPVVMPVAWQAVPGEALRTLEPVSPLREAVRLGFAESTVDADGVLRSTFIEAGPKGRPYPHFALAMLRAAGGHAHPQLALENDDADPDGSAAGGPGGGAWVRQGRFLIRYDGPPGNVTRVSYLDVLRGAVPESTFTGRFVFVGMTAQGLGDTLATPVNASRHAMPGVEVNANILETLRSGRAVRALPPLAAGALSAAGVLALVVTFAFTGTRPALMAALAALPMALGAAWLALRSGWWWSPAPFLLCAVLAYPLWSWRRLERGVDLLDREITRLAEEPGMQVPAIDARAAPARDRLAIRLAALHTAADTLRSARRFLADALAGLPTAMLVDDGAGRVLLANPPAAELFEIESAPEMDGLDLARLLAEFECTPAVDWPQVLDDVRRTRTDFAVQARLPAQGDHVIHAHGVEMHGGTRIIVAVTDIALIKRAERARDEMLAFISHDLRAPATSIGLLASMHLAGDGTFSHDALLREMQRLAQRTVALADDFVRVAQAVHRPLQRVAVMLGDVWRDAAADYEPQAQAAGVRLLLDPPEAHAGEVSIDRSLVTRALGNLLSNAIKHSPPGSRIRLSARATAEGGCAFEVTDQGPGLSNEAMQRLMIEHDGLLPAEARGVGYGLLFVQRVAQRHDGRLRVRPGPSAQGTVFELVLGPPPRALPSLT